MLYSEMSPQDVRALIREGKITSPTSGMCAGYAQANLVILPKEYAADFWDFTQKNPKACPLLECTKPGERYLSVIAKGADIATEIPKYRVYRNGEMTDELTDVSSLWNDDLVSFLLGCSFSFESALLDGGVPVRHIEENRNVPMYKTNIPCISAGPFHGNVVVSMRPIPFDLVAKAINITSHMPRVHGAPCHVGCPEILGIEDISRPDFGDAVTIKDGEVPVFWHCGVTPQNVLMQTRPPFAITHAPGHMFITDLLNVSLMSRD